jgi:hypothetical protein
LEQWQSPATGNQLIIVEANKAAATDEVFADSHFLLFY